VVFAVIYVPEFAINLGVISAKMLRDQLEQERTAILRPLSMSKAKKSPAKKKIAKSESAHSRIIEVRIMIAVWELTQDDPSKYVTCGDIANEIYRLHGGKRRTDDYIRRVINEMQKLYVSYSVFEEGKLGEGDEFKHTETTFRLGKTVVLGDTAQFLLSIVGKTIAHRIPSVAVAQAIEECAKNYHFDKDKAQDKLEELVDAKYLNRLMNGDYSSAGRFTREKTYIQYVANKFTSSTSNIASTEPTSNSQLRQIKK
jgi:hypothetical protein